MQGMQCVQEVANAMAGICHLIRLVSNYRHFGPCIACLNLAGNYALETGKGCWGTL